MKLDNKGITMVELMIAMAASTIIFSAAMLFLNSAHKGYETAATEIDLQSESQVLTQQLSEWIMEGNKIETETGKIQVYYQNTAIAGLTRTKRIIWLGNNGKLYMKKFDDITADITDADENIENCIGEYVVEFTPAWSRLEPQKVTLDVKMKLGRQEYQWNYLVKIRNKVDV